MRLGFLQRRADLADARDGAQKPYPFAAAARAVSGGPDVAGRCRASWRPSYCVTEASAPLRTPAMRPSSGFPIFTPECHWNIDTFRRPIWVSQVGGDGIG